VSTTEQDLKELAFRHQEISKTLITIAQELKEIKEAVKQTSDAIASIPSALTRLEKR